VASSCEHGNEPSGFIKGGEFHDWLSDSYFPKDSASWSLVKLRSSGCDTV
jgi:hypothetical protein